jgi:topoisomerase IA-like protein
MPSISKAVVDADLRERVFDALIIPEDTEFIKINDRQYGIILTDLNGNERYVRVGAIVAEERTDKTARQLMAEEIGLYTATKAKNEKKAQERAKSAEADKAKREAKAKAKAEKAE